MLYSIKPKTAHLIANKIENMKKAALTLGACLTLCSCGGGTDAPTFEENPPPNLSDENRAAFTVVPEPNTPPEANTRILFTPSLSILPSNVNDLLFAENTDGTATTEITDPAVTPAINDLDGFSTLGQLDFAFDGPILDSSICTLQNLSLLGAGQLSAVPPTRQQACATQGVPNLFVLPLTLAEGADPLDATQITGVDQVKLKALNYRADVITLDCPSTTATENTENAENAENENTENDHCQNSVLRITPLSPLPTKTKLLVAFTNGLKDDPNGDGLITDGEQSLPVGPSLAYHGIGEPPHSSESVEQLFRLITGLEQVILGLSDQSNFGLTSDDIIYTQTITTTAPTDVLTALAAPLAFNPDYAPFARLLPSAAPRPTTFYKETALGPGQPGHLGQPSETNPTGLFNAPSAIVEGAIKLPYYLTAPSSDEADPNRGDVILDVAWTGSANVGDVIESSTGLPENSTPPADNDGTFNVTYRYPFPTETGEEVVPVTVMLPSLPAIQSAAAANPESAAAAMLATLDPENPQWPTIVYAVGITTDRSINLLAANALAGACLTEDPEAVGTQCFATVTIDHPVHGLAAKGARIPGVLTNVDQTPPANIPADFTSLHERHFGFTANEQRRPIPMAYDNDNPENSVGTSGSLAINLANFQNSRDKLRQSVVDHLNLLASLDDIAITSEYGESTVNHSLNTDRVYFIGHSLGGVIGVPLVATNNHAGVQDNNEHLPRIQAAAFLHTSGGMGKLLENMPDSSFGASVTLAGLAIQTFDPTTGEYGVKQGSSDLESFLYYFQNTLDSVDPMNFAGALREDSTAILATEVIGGLDQESDPRDQTIPIAADASVHQLEGDYADLGITEPFKHPLAGFCPIPDAIDPATGACGESLLGPSAPALPDVTALPAPLVGTEALIAEMGLQPVSSDHGGTDPLKVAIRFTDGEHGTPVSPINPISGESHLAEYQEILTQLISFFSSNGTQIAVGTASDAIYQPGNSQ